MSYTFALGEFLILPIAGLFTYIFRRIFKDEEDKDKEEVCLTVFIITFFGLTTLWLFLLQSS